MNSIMGEQIRGALARGYCSDKNSHKELDSTLIEAMATELEPVIQSLLKQQIEDTVNSTLHFLLGDINKLRELNNEKPDYLTLTKEERIMIKNYVVKLMENQK